MLGPHLSGVAFVVLLFALIVGCGTSEYEQVTGTQSAPAPEAPAPEPPPAPVTRSEPPATSQVTEEPEVEEERQVAVAGVGKKGSSYGGGIISEPVSQYFGARERIAFMSVTKAMRTFNALHDRDPESHEEFMEEIIKENGIQLPGLFDGERYEYDPETAELMVVRPKKK